MEQGKTGKLYAVSTGPGDPELLTYKAARALQSCDIVFAPHTGGEKQVALDIVREHIEGKRVVSCSTPMTKDQAVLDAAYDAIAKQIAELLDDGHVVAFIALGDITVYSTYFRVHERLEERGYDIEIIPGVTSFCAAAARLGRPLCQGADRLLVVPVAHHDIDDCLDVNATKVFMKSARSIMGLKDKLAERGVLDKASLVVNCGMEGERVYPAFSDLDETSGYFSLVIVEGESHE